MMLSSVLIPAFLIVQTSALRFNMKDKDVKLRGRADNTNLTHTCNVDNGDGDDNDGDGNDCHLCQQSRPRLLDNDCPSPDLAVPLFRGFKAESQEHFYTITHAEFTKVVVGGESHGHIVGRIFPTQFAHTVPLYRSWGLQDLQRDFVKRNGTAVDAIQNKEVVGYVFPQKVCGGVPFYHLMNAGTQDHFCTTLPEERKKALMKLRYADQGIAGYILPP